MLKGGTQTPPHVHVEKFSYRCPVSRGIPASVQMDFLSLGSHGEYMEC
jgi:hypothetical protein